MTVPYATVRDVYDLGLSARAFVVRPMTFDPRAGDGFDPASGTFSILGHGLASDDLTRLVLIASGGALPGGASALATYYPLPLDHWRFRLSLSEGGAPVTFTTAGTSSTGGAFAWGVQVDPERRLERIILAVSADLDQDLTAHSTPIAPEPVTGKYPLKLTGITARIAARRAIVQAMFENAQIKVASERLLAEEKRDDEQRAAWRLGQPLLPTPRDQTEGIAENAMRAGNGPIARCCNRPPVCWPRNTL